MPDDVLRLDADSSTSRTPIGMKPDQVGYLSSLPATGLDYLHTYATSVELQAERVLREPPNSAEARADAFQLIHALRQAARAAHLVAKNLTGDNAQQARAAIAAFEVVVPDAKDARDVLDHFDDYAQGLGDLSHPQTKRGKRAPTEAAARQFPIFWERGAPDDYVIHIGHLTVDVTAARNATLTLAKEIRACVFSPTSDDEALAAFGPMTADNPAAVALAVFTVLGRHFVAPDEELADVVREWVTPESVDSWGDFNGAAELIQGLTLASKPEFATPDVAYMKLLPDQGESYQATADSIILRPQFITLHRDQSSEDTRWLVHQLGNERPLTL